MKSVLLASVFTALAAAAPVPVPEHVATSNVIAGDVNDLEARQFGMGMGMDMSRNDLESGSGTCPKAIFIFARGSTEPGNMGASVGPTVANTLTNQLGKGQVWIQGVGGPYIAGLPENAMPAGSSPAAIAEMDRLFTLAHTKCPTSSILAGGYSQGAALAAAAVSNASPEIRNQIVATVLFGYTKNLQNGGKIPNYPADRVKVFCNPGDMVCTGSLVITPAHLNYLPQAGGAAPQFLESKVTTVPATQAPSAGTGAAAAAPAAAGGTAATAPAAGTAPEMNTFTPQVPAAGGSGLGSGLGSGFGSGLGSGFGSGLSSMMNPLSFWKNMMPGIPGM
ncbi:hypothetical protein E4U60_005915 [Claviceps pazoutovae]|uniref:cutinase n=1 Tax=Claviceps pazoutovae TaxID=1649127 RepID=A0A9P7SEW6_9HYPO|nr:hypothetical protein E4U60_005915 [Claviceps pazoutovae]